MCAQKWFQNVLEKIDFVGADLIKSEKVERLCASRNFEKSSYYSIQTVTSVSSFASAIIFGDRMYKLST